MGATVHGLLAVVLLLSVAITVLLVILLKLDERCRNNRGQHVDRHEDDDARDEGVHWDAERDEDQQRCFCYCSGDHEGLRDDAGDAVLTDSDAAEERGNYQHGDDLRKDGHGGCAHVPEFTEEVSR